MVEQRLVKGAKGGQLAGNSRAALQGLQWPLAGGWLW